MKRIAAFALSFFFVVTPALAHGDHDHDHDHAAEAAQGVAAPQVEMADTELEFVGRISDRQLKIHLDRFATNEPVSGAQISGMVDGIPAGRAKEISPGRYELAAPWADDPGSKPLRFTITLEGKKTVLEGTLEILAAEHTHDEAAGLNWTQLLAQPQAWLIAAAGLVVGFVLALAFRKRPLDTLPVILFAAGLAVLGPDPVLAHEGHGEESTPAVGSIGTGDAPQRLPNGDIVFPKASQHLLHVRTAIAEASKALRGRELIGTVVPDPSTFGQVQAPMDGRIELAERGISHVGQHVKAGEVLAYLSPSIPIADLGTMQQLTAEVAGKLKIAEQRLARLTKIAGVVAQKEIDDTRAELEALREQQRVLERKDVELMPLTAPVSGIISVANVRAGQVVTTRDTLFEIVDPDRVWIEAVGAAGHATHDVVAAHVTDLDGHSIPIEYIGRAPSLRQQTQPLQFKVLKPHEGLTIGSAVKVYMQQGEPEEGIVLPEAAVVRARNGLPQVWTKIGPQLFRPEPVRIAPLDGENVLVLDGIQPGGRVVVEGAELVNQVR